MFSVTKYQFYLLFTSSFVLVGLLTPIIRRIAITHKVIDKPNSHHKSHKKPVPYLGGVAIIVGIIFVTYVAILGSPLTSETFWLATTVLIPAVLIGLVGLIDDIRNLPPWPRFLAQTLVAGFSTIVIIINDKFGSPTGSKIFDIFISIFWIIGLCNAINLFDNIDGGAAGSVAICTLTSGIFAIQSGQFSIAALSFVTSGATLGFLIWNKNPARIYMGDAGSLFLGFLVAVILLRLKFEVESNLLSLLIPIFLVALPIIDTAVVVITRLNRGISPFMGGQDHLSHRLLKLGIRKQTTVATLWSLSTVFSLFALGIYFFQSYSIFIAIIGISLFFILLILFIRLKI